MTDGQRIPGRFAAGWAHGLAWLADHGLWNTAVTGQEYVPQGPAILAGNHSGLMDGPVMMGAAPRGVHILIKQELARPPFGWVMLAAGQVPVDRAAGGSALQVCLELLDRGRLVGIFPEGSRGDGRMGKIHPGVAWLAVHSGAPVVPFACLGTRRQGESIGHFPPPRRRLAVIFGAPLELEFPPGAAGRAKVSTAIGQIATGLAAHVAAAERATGIYLPTDQGRKDHGQ